VKKTNDYRKEYNELLKKEQSQNMFFQSNMFKAMGDDNKKELLKQYKATADKLNDLLALIGWNVTPEQILKGFEVKEYVSYKGVDFS
jgi:hypothetical protein